VKTYGVSRNYVFVQRDISCAIVTDDSLCFSAYRCYFDWWCYSDKSMCSI